MSTELEDIENEGGELMMKKIMRNEMLKKIEEKIIEKDERFIKAIKFMVERDE